MGVEYSLVDSMELPFRASAYSVVIPQYAVSMRVTLVGAGGQSYSVAGGRGGSITMYHYELPGLPRSGLPD